MFKTKPSRLTLSCLGAAALFASSACTVNRIDGGGDDDGDGGMSDMRTTKRDMVRNLDASCASVSAEASLTKKPVDIIFVIDNSGSMSDEALAVNNNINNNFADIISKSGLDYRVIMVTRHGPYNGALTCALCVTKPLSTLASCSPVPNKPGINPPVFYHYSRQIESNDSFLRLINSYNGNEPDEFGLAPMGWSQWLRPDAFKVFIGITDDESTMTETDFEKNLFAKTPKMFGDAMNRNYVWHSIIGLHENSPATKPWAPTDPVQTSLCTNGGGAVAAGVKYQNLSKLTGGMRFPICEHASFDAVFQGIAMGVISGAKIACDFPVPEAPAGQTVDLGSVIVQYTQMGMGSPQQFHQVANLAVCDPNGFYIDNKRIYMCPETCSAVQKDDKAKLQIVFDCNIG